MKFPKSWLKTFIDLPDNDQDLAEKLSIAGLEVEEIIQHKKALCNVVSAQIKEIKKHPEADRLVITQCHDGQNMHQIVTGANNINEGDIVPLALPNALLAKGLKIKKSKLRGIDSAGMLCSESELGLCDEANGIWILDQDMALGLDLVAHFSLNDCIFDIGILPNRGDCQSIYGLARELSAILNIPLKAATWQAPKPSFKSKIKINNTQIEQAPYYSARVLKNCQNAQSPAWLKANLWRCDLKPIALTIDITNYVLLEYGQPLHAFSQDKLTQQNTNHALSLNIRFAKDKESIKTLDEKEQILSQSDIVIDHEQQVIAIAGVMGGFDSGSNTDTSTKETLILEAANFNPVHVRRTAQRLNLRSESAIRFEKGIDQNQIQLASDRAAQLYHSLAQAEIGECDIQQRESNSLSIPFSTEKINQILGSTYSDTHIISQLNKLGFNIDKSACVVPSWRQHDCKTQACLAEEVARLDGFSAIPDQLPQGPNLHPAEQAHLVQRRQLRQGLANLGFNECCSFPMISAKDWQLTHATEKPKWIIQNPISQDQAILRDSLLSNLLTIYKSNQRNQQTHTHFFEIGTCFKTESEDLNLGILMGGQWLNSYDKNTEALKKSSLAHLKSCLEQVFTDKKLALTMNPNNPIPSISHPSQYLNITENKQSIGACFEVHPNTLKAAGIKGQVFFAELRLNKTSTKTPQF
eukprot:COSAG05_NODE_3240_length_2215_cov_1.053403_1_plen_694_part_10